jgi:uncharacterized DUF497 family protein
MSLTLPSPEALYAALIAREPRFRVIGEVLQDILVVVYTPRGSTCRLITAWEAEDWKLDLWYERFS